MFSIYVIQILLILFFGYLFRNDKKKFLTAAFIILFVVMAFRDAGRIGYDYSSSYYIEYEGIKTKELSWPNPGLPIIMKAIKNLNGDYQWIIVITAIVVCFAYYKLLVKYSENGFISVMWFMGMFFYTFLFSALKQAWAMAFLCFAFDAIFEKKPLRFVVLVGLAVLFHFPALIFLPAYWIAKLQINRSFPILMFSVLVIVYIFRSQIVSLMTSAYSKGNLEYSSTVAFLGTKFVLMVLILLYALYLYYTAEAKNRVLGALIYFMGLAAVIQTFCFYSNTFERLADFYYQFSILFMPLVVKGNTYDSKETVQSDLSYTNGISGSGDSLAKKRIIKYTFADISVSTVFAVVITVFCVWRYVSYMQNDAFFSPFYFFWQNG